MVRKVQERNRLLYGWVEMDKRKQERLEFEAQLKKIDTFLEDQQKRIRVLKMEPKKRELIALAFQLGSSNTRKSKHFLSQLVFEEARKNHWDVTFEGVDHVIRRADFEELYEGMKEMYKLTPDMLEAVKFGSVDSDD